MCYRKDVNFSCGCRKEIISRPCVDDGRPRCHRVQICEIIKERCNRTRGVCIHGLKTEVWPKSSPPLDVTKVVKTLDRLMPPKSKNLQGLPMLEPKSPKDPSLLYPEWQLEKALIEQRRQARRVVSLRQPGRRPEQNRTQTAPRRDFQQSQRGRTDYWPEYRPAPWSDHAASARQTPPACREQRYRQREQRWGVEQELQRSVGAHLGS